MKRWKKRPSCSKHMVLCWIILPLLIVVEALIYHRYLFVVKTHQTDDVELEAASLKSNFLISQSNGHGDSQGQQYQNLHQDEQKEQPMSRWHPQTVEEKIEQLRRYNPNFKRRFGSNSTIASSSSSSSQYSTTTTASSSRERSSDGSRFSTKEQEYLGFLGSLKNAASRSNIRKTNAEILASVGINISEYNNYEDNYMRRRRRNRSRDSQLRDARANTAGMEDRSDGIFNGYPIYRVSPAGRNGDRNDASSGGNDNIYSRMHCIGETWSPPKFLGRQKKYVDTSFIYRSCHFEFFCYDTYTEEFVVYFDPNDVKVDQTDNNQGQHQEQQQHWKDEFLHTMSEDYRHNTTIMRLWDISQTLYDNVTTVFTPSTGPKRKKVLDDLSLLNNPFTYPYGVSLGSINTKWTWASIPKLKWFPTIRYGRVPIDGNSNVVNEEINLNDSSDNNVIDAVYTLPSSVVMAPFHSLAAFNPGHLVWDDFLPLYTLLQIFNKDNKSRPDDDGEDDFELLMMRYILPPEIKVDGTVDKRGLWAGCDWRDDRNADCNFMLNKFAPLMMPNPDSWNVTSQKHVNFRVWNKDGGENDDSDSGNNNKKDHRALICAKNGLAGIGSLSDHGTEKGHGWNEEDYKTTYNHGRGGQLYRFRNFMLRNIGIDDPTRPINPHTGQPMIVYFSENSSAKAHRAYTFEIEQEALKMALQERSVEFGLPPVEIQSHSFKRFTVHEQALLVSQAAIYVSACGGGAVTATFLPRGSSLILAFSETGGIENNKYSNKPARLDWDYFNNLSYLRVHWLPQAHYASGRSQPRDIASFVDLVLHELQTVYRDRIRRWNDYQAKRVIMEHNNK